MGDLKLKLTDGSIAVPIEIRGADGELLSESSFRFNPSDVGLAIRYEETIAGLEKLELKENDFNSWKTASEDVKQLMDYFLGYDSTELFKICNPFTPVANGDFYIEVVMAGLAEIVESQTKERLAKKQARIKRATSKYHN